MDQISKQVLHRSLNKARSLYAAHLMRKKIVTFSVVSPRSVIRNVEIFELFFLRNGAKIGSIHFLLASNSITMIATTPTLQFALSTYYLIRRNGVVEERNSTKKWVEE